MSKYGDATAHAAFSLNTGRTSLFLLLLRLKNKTKKQTCCQGPGEPMPPGTTSLIPTHPPTLVDFLAKRWAHCPQKHTHTHTHTHTRARARAHAHARTHAFTLARTHTHTHTHKQTNKATKKQTKKQKMRNFRKFLNVF